MNAAGLAVDEVDEGRGGAVGTALNAPETVSMMDRASGKKQEEQARAASRSEEGKKGKGASGSSQAAEVHGRFQLIAGEIDSARKQ